MASVSPWVEACEKAMAALGCGAAAAGSSGFVKEAGAHTRPHVCST